LRRLAQDLLRRIGQKLLNGGEDDPARLPAFEQLPKVGAALGLNRLLPQQLAAAGEDAEELVVQVVAVGQHDNGRVLHLGQRAIRAA
jgi:hypothetical protein